MQQTRELSFDQQTIDIEGRYRPLRSVSDKLELNEWVVVVDVVGRGGGRGVVFVV